MLINPGSHVHRRAQGKWTNTFAKACEIAQKWLKSMHDDDGMTDVELVNTDPEMRDGRWTFTFCHKVTGAHVILTTHGIDDQDEYRKDAIFTPRIYWNGSSTGDPKLEDFAAPGFRMHKTFVPVTSNDGAK